VVTGPFTSGGVRFRSDADLQWLVDNRMPEGDRLEYKRDMYGGADKQRLEMLRDVTSMANHRGGHILIGVEEGRDGTAVDVPGVEPSQHDPWDVWLTNICLTTIEPRILGLRIEQIDLVNGKHVVVVEVPESPNAPHMVIFNKTNNFWKRHGRRKDVMTVDEIRDTVLRVLDNQGRIERLLTRRDAEIEPQFRGQCYLVISAMPAVFDGRTVIDVNHYQVRYEILRADLGFREPLPTIDGIRAMTSLKASEHRGPISGDYLEVYRLGYVELGVWIESNRPGGGLYYSPYGDTRYMIEFVNLIGKFNQVFLELNRLQFRAKIFNAERLHLHLRGRLTGDELIKLVKPLPSDGHLDLGTVVVENAAEEASQVPRLFCDRLWNAYGYEASNILDAEGRLIGSY
jgi:hypothetical protein